MFEITVLKNQLLDITLEQWQTLKDESNENETDFENLRGNTVLKSCGHVHNTQQEMNYQDY